MEVVINMRDRMQAVFYVLQIVTAKYVATIVLFNFHSQSDCAEICYAVVNL